MSGEARKKDVARQAANVAGSLFQVGVPILFAGADVGRVSSENSTLVVPAGYAFGIWGVIFLLCFAYAGYQALPANRDKEALRRIGWLTAGAFFFNGLWEILFPARQFLLAQVVIVGVFACSAGAYLRFAREARGRPLSRAERWLVSPTLGLLFGWITAATTISFATTLVALGLLGGGTGEALLGAILLLLGGLLAAAMILYAKADQVSALYLSYAAAVLWALVAVFVNQYGASLLTAGAAAVSAVVVALVLVTAPNGGSGGRGRARRVSRGTARSGVA